MVLCPKSIDMALSDKIEIKFNIDKMRKHVDKAPLLTARCVDMPTVYLDQTKYDGRKHISG